MSGKKILDGLKDAVAGNFAAVTIEGQHWVRREWQPIETAPKDTEVLICGLAYGKPYSAVAKLEDGIWMLFDPLDDSYSAESYGHTHWMPLPAPPVPLGK